MSVLVINETINLSDHFFIFYILYCKNSKIINIFLDHGSIFVVIFNIPKSFQKRRIDLAYLACNLFVRKAYVNPSRALYSRYCNCDTIFIELSNNF